VVDWTGARVVLARPFVVVRHSRIPRYAPAAAALALAVALASETPADQGSAAAAVRADADRCQEKLDRIARFGLDPAPPGARPRRTVLTERELNAYTRVVLQPQLPAGVVDPVVELVGDGRFAVRLVVDFDRVRGAGDRALVDPVRYVGGQMSVSLVGVLRTTPGRGVLELVSATAGGVPLPKVLVQEIVAYATRNPDTPAGLRFDEPFPLPANIREIVVGLGQATVIQ
jgi:hypothetical protein